MTDLKAFFQLNLSPVPIEGKIDWLVRPEIDKKLKFLTMKWDATEESYINVLWADFGQGKTHTLFYIENLTIWIRSHLQKSNQETVDVLLERSKLH